MTIYEERRPVYVDCDFETASDVDLPLVGADTYAQDVTTEVLVLRFEIEGNQYEWRPGDDDIAYLANLAASHASIFIAHNAGFEQAIWRHIMVPDYGFPEIPIERWEDTMATCAWKAIPLSLDRAAMELGLVETKDKEGRNLTLSMSKPMTQVAHMEEYPGKEWGTKVAWEKLFKPGRCPEKTPERMERISRYCAQDVKVETALRKRIGLLSEQSPQERQVWIYDQKINQRGIRVDLDFVRAAERVCQGATVALLQEFRERTGGINPGQVAKLTEWCRAQGVVLDNMQKEYLEGLLGVSEEEGYVSNAVDEGEVRQDLPGNGLPGRVRRVLEIRQMLGSASIKKLPRMRACVSPDGRARGLLQYHAAGPGRWGGRLLQPHNFPRGVGLVYAAEVGGPVSIEEQVAAVMTGDYHECSRFYKEAAGGKRVPIEPIEFIACCLRYALVADPGKVFLVGDFAGIEARVVLALAGQHDRTRELVEKGSGVYLTMAEKIYGIPEGAWSADKATIDKAKKEHIREYTIGKNTVLGCGFQMGGATFHGRYCSDQPREFADNVVQAYRKEWAPKVPPLWYALGDAALAAAEGTPTEKYGVRYQLEDGWLTARLPSGWQKLWYFNPQPETNRFGKPAWSYQTTTAGKWIKKGAYGGLLTENTVQALARGILCAALDRLECSGMPVVLSVHDELVCEVDEGSADLKAFEQIMAEPTQWARDIKIPIAVEAWQGSRYRK